MSLPEVTWEYRSSGKFLSRFRQQSIYLVSAGGLHLKKHIMKLNSEQSGNHLTKRGPLGTRGPKFFAESKETNYIVNVHIWSSSRKKHKM